MAKKEPKIDFEKISKKLAKAEEQQHIDQIAPALKDVYIKHAKYTDSKGVVRFKRKFDKKSAEKLSDDLYNALGYHTHRRFFGMEDKHYNNLLSIKDSNGNPYVDSIISYHFDNISRKALKNTFARDDKENYITAKGIEKALEKPIKKHAGMIQNGILGKENLEDPKHMNKIKGAIDNIVGKHKLSKKRYNTKKMNDPEEVLGNYVQLSRENYQD
jgi:hypothetical protein